MEHEWQKLTAMTNGKPFHITKVSVPEDGITIEGNFQLPPLGKLGYEDQVFVAAFVKTHGTTIPTIMLLGDSCPGHRHQAFHGCRTCTQPPFKWGAGKVELTNLKRT